MNIEKGNTDKRTSRRKFLAASTKGALKDWYMWSISG